MPPSGGIDAGDYAQQGSLAAAVGADDGHALAIQDGEVEGAEERAPVHRFADALQLEDFHATALGVEGHLDAVTLKHGALGGFATGALDALLHALGAGGKLGVLFGPRLRLRRMTSSRFISSRWSV